MVQISKVLKIGVMSDQWMVSLYMVIVQNVVSHLGELDLILLYKILIPTIEVGVT